MGRRKVVKEEGEHDVTISITIAKATETDFEAVNFNQSKKGKVIEAPKAQSYFHCSYKLLPDDKESVKTDVVTFGVAAKLYTEHDSRVLRPWVDGEKTWVAWTTTHKVRVTKDVLLKMFNHSLDLKIWDAKEKVSPRARFDRPKAFKMPQMRANEESEIEHMKRLISIQLKDAQTDIGKRNFRKKIQIDDSTEGGDRRRTVMLGRTETDLTRLRSESHQSNQTSTSSKQRKHSLVVKAHQDAEKGSKQPVKIVEEKVQDQGQDDLKSENRVSGDQLAAQQSIPGDPNGSLKVKVFLDENKQPQMANLMKLAASGITLTTEDEDNDENEYLLFKQKTLDSRPVSEGKSSQGKSHSAERKADAMAAYIKTHGLASVQVKLSALFTGVKSINNRLGSRIGTVEDLLIKLTLDTALLSEPQRKILNPMVIRVSSACNMPSKPLSYRELQDKCIPPYISYKFYDESAHEACGSQHAAKLSFDDNHVVLLGIKDKEKLKEYFRGPGLEIEVHDRDRDLSQKRSLPTIFGSHQDDEMISKASLITGRRTEHNPFTKKEKSWDPYGVARLNMSDLLLGEKIIELSIPIRGCKIPDVVDGRGSGIYAEKIVGKIGSVDGPEYAPLATANYLEAGSELKVKVEIAYPIKTIEEIHSKTITESPKECPFARLVYIFEYHDKFLLDKIQKEVISINAETLQLKDFPQHVTEAALSTYKLTESQRVSKTLNIITGFQIIDGRFHIFVLEGLRDFGIKSLWNNLQYDVEDSHSNVTTLYNTDVTFQERLYATLDVDLTRVRLHQSLDTIVKLPLLYVRDMIPRLCFQAVLKLHDLTNCKRLRDAIRNEMFPTDEMIASLGREFGIPLTTEDLEDVAEATKTSETVMYDSETLNEKPYKTTRPWTPLQLKNQSYEEVLKSRLASGTRRNFLADNIAKVHKMEPSKRELTITCDSSELMSKEVHNYSIQSLNTTEMAKKKLRHCLSEDPDSRYTYNQTFNSATVIPIDPVSVQKEELVKSRKSWQTYQGFVFPGKKTSIESNKHALEPDVARLDELRKPWRENILHSNKLKPTVKRVKFSWEDRAKDFDLLKKPRDYFGKPAPVTIHLAGDTLANERRLAAEKEREIWENSLAVDDPTLRTYRCSTQTELLDKGFKSSSQVARLDDILRDEPRKHALSAPGLRFDKIPALSVVLNPTVDPFLTFYERLRIGSDLASDVEKEKGFNPGPMAHRSWLLESNKVPISDYNHGYFIEKKGADFSLCNTPKEKIYKRTIKPLFSEEKSTSLWQGRPTEKT